MIEIKIDVDPIFLKKIYQQPQLKNFGDLRKITQGGSGSQKETVAAVGEYRTRKP